MTHDTPSNARIADMLDEVADLREQQDGNPYRVRSYRRAAQTVRELEQPAKGIFQRDGVEGLKRLPGVGERLGGAIGEIIETGELGLLQRLRSQVKPTETLTRVPGVGPELAERIHDELGTESLEELEIAAHDGRLAEVEGVGEKKLQGIRDALAGMLSRPARRRAQQRATDKPDDRKQESSRPPVSTLLDVDAEYREKAEAGELRTIAPRRFNPEGKAWLPVLETTRNGWSMTALYSNTASAHERGKTRDWVVIYWSNDEEEGQNTVVTAKRGKRKGKRVVRGREGE